VEEYSALCFDARLLPPQNLSFLSTRLAHAARLGFFFTKTRHINSLLLLLLLLILGLQCNIRVTCDDALYKLMFHLLTYLLTYCRSARHCRSCRAPEDPAKNHNRSLLQTSEDTTVHLFAKLYVYWRTHFVSTAIFLGHSFIHSFL